jgi:transcriptional regulator with PAS, ATPase and Fis domain
LLRVLEDQKVHRLGGSHGIQVDMRVIAATNVPLKELVAEGKMRSDFYYRINVIPIQLIPLRQRKVDIPLLVQDSPSPLCGDEQEHGLSFQTGDATAHRVSVAR